MFAVGGREGRDVGARSIADGAGEVLGLRVRGGGALLADGVAAEAGVRGVGPEAGAVDAAFPLRRVGAARRRGGRAEFEDVDGVAGAADAEESAGGVEGHTVDARGHAAAAELV